MQQHTIHLLTFEGCPHAQSARASVLSAISGFGASVELIEFDLHDPATPAEFVRYPSPTVLVGMSDVSGSAAVSEGLSCRASGAPSAEEVRAAMDAAWGPVSPATGGAKPGN